VDCIVRLPEAFIFVPAPTVICAPAVEILAAALTDAIDISVFGKFIDDRLTGAELSLNVFVLFAAAVIEILFPSSVAPFMAMSAFAAVVPAVVSVVGTAVAVSVISPPV